MFLVLDNIPRSLDFRREISPAYVTVGARAQPRPLQLRTASCDCHGNYHRWIFRFYALWKVLVLFLSELEFGDSIVSVFFFFVQGSLIDCGLSIEIRV